MKSAVNGDVLTSLFRDSSRLREVGPNKDVSSADLAKFMYKTFPHGSCIKPLKYHHPEKDNGVDSVPSVH